jgi:hypothetical protein
MLPMFSCAQFQFKRNAFTTMTRSLLKNQTVPLFSFFKVYKKSTNTADTLMKSDKKISMTGNLYQQNRINNRLVEIYNQAAEKSETNYPTFENYYFKLAFFAGVIYENRTHLSWQTDINENIRYFFIERSTDRRTFNKVGEIDLFGKASLKNFYFTDSSISNSLLYYYQVKALLIDGSYMISEFIPVKNGEVELIATLSPGKEKDLLVLKTNQPVRKIEAINTEGEVVFRNKKVSREETVNISEYLPGSYTLKIIGNNGFVTQLFFKKEDNNK